MKMESFEYTELTLVGDKVDDDGKRFDVLKLNPISVESFDACNMSVFWFRRKIVGRLRKKPMFMPMSALSW